MYIEILISHVFRIFSAAVKKTVEMEKTYENLMDTEIYFLTFRNSSAVVKKTVEIKKT